MGTTNTNKNNDQAAKSTAKKPKKYAPTDTIECRSVTGGELILIGDKTKLHYNWADFGDTAYVEYQDLQALQSRRSGFLTHPRFIIEDDNLVDQWGSMLKPIYDKINTKNIDDTTLINMTISCKDIGHFNSIVSRLRNIKDVIRVTRVVSASK